MFVCIPFRLSLGIAIRVVVALAKPKLMANEKQTVFVPLSISRSQIKAIDELKQVHVCGIEWPAHPVTIVNSSCSYSVSLHVHLLL